MADVKPTKTLLQEFLESIEQIPGDLVAAALKSSENEDEKAIINAFAPTLVNQFRELSTYITEISYSASKQTLVEVERLLKMTSGVSLVKSLKVALPSIGSIIGKLGIAGIIKEIKKIIYFILQTFFPNLPKWVWELILLIDQIINDILGGGIIKIKNALSEAEINYLAELKGLVQLQIATRDLGDTQDDE